MPDVTTWLNQLPTISANPAAIQRLALAQLDDTLNGKVDIVDATNPFIFLMEASSVNAASNVLEAKALTRKQYASMALTQEDLYLHMSDKDYVGRFAEPSRAGFYLLLGKEELYARAVPTGNGDIRKLTIPRNSVFTINEINFTMQYPIEIRVMGHGGLQIVYNTDSVSPLQTLSTNIVTWSIVSIQGTEFVRIEIPVQQFSISRQIAKLNLTTGFSKTYGFKDQFYYARAYTQNSQGSWTEVRTTHTDQVFDPTVPTVVFKVLDQKLQVTVPQIYLTNRSLTSELAIDIYTTKGPLNLVLGDYDINNFLATWVDLQSDAESAFYAPLSVFTQIALYSDETVIGGRDALTFDQLRQRVILNNLGNINLPITNVQLTSTLQDLGYDPVCDVDIITNRIFLATRTLPVPSNGGTVSGAACTIQTLQASMDDLVKFATVQDNGDRITILPTTLFKLDNGILSVVSDVAKSTLQGLALDAKARAINQSNYLYTPFHYVLDKTGDIFDLRAYYLNNPSIESKTFVEENDTAGLEVGTGKFAIARTDNGYVMTLTCKSSDAWKALSDDDVYCQLAYVPAGEKDRAYLNGTLQGYVDNERVYAFELGTNYDIDAEDQLVLNTFQMYGNAPREHAVKLLEAFDVFYVATGITPPGLESSQIDLDMGSAILPDNSVGIVHETLQVKLGVALDGLWRRSRSVASSEDYERYTADVPALYSETIYKRDPDTGQVIITADGDGNISYEVLHAKGDPVLDDDGNPTMAHHAGDVKLDPDGNPIVVSTRQLLRKVDLCMVEGVYWFTDEQTAAAYKLTIPKTLAGWITKDIGLVSEKLIEITKLYFYPKSTIGSVKALIREGKEVTLPAQQDFQVTYYLTQSAYRNSELRKPLTDAAVDVINNALKNKTVAISDIVATLKATIGDDVVAIDVNGLGGSQDLPALTVLDDSARLSINKVAVAEADGTIGVTDSVTVTFLQHSV